MPGLLRTTVLAFLIAQNSVSAVKEVTGVASSALAPATLAGRGVIELIRADARMFPRGPNFFAWEPPEDLATLGVWQCPLALLFGKSLDANSGKPLTATVLTAPSWVTRRYGLRRHSRPSTLEFEYGNLRRC